MPRKRLKSLFGLFEYQRHPEFRVSDMGTLSHRKADESMEVLDLSLGLVHRSTAAARGAAVQALVAAAVADHDRAAFGAARGVLLDLERDVRRSEAERHRPGAVAVPRLAGLRRRVTVGGHD